MTAQKPIDNPDPDFWPCTWEDVRIDQARRFAALTPDQKLEWLMGMLELFPHILESAKTRPMPGYGSDSK